MKYVDPYTLHHSERLVACWASINQTGTQAVEDSYNVSSITDSGTATTTVNFDNDLNNDDYSVAGLCSEASDAGLTISSRSVGSVRLKSRHFHAGNPDSNPMTVVIFGDPA